MLEALPRSFDFYHLGQIELQEDELPSSSDRIAIAYTLEGEARGALLLLLDEGLDLSTYSEAGNIIASRLATALSARHGLEVTISPPRVLSRAQLQTVLNTGGEKSARSYLHRHGSRAISLEAVLLSAVTVPSEGTGNA
jgi:chemotaxis protein CheY-P-specific phosphatase CheC